MQDWLKLHTDLLDNPDVALMSAEDYQIATFLWMLCRKEGFTDGRLIGWDFDRLAYRFRKSVECVTSAVTSLSRPEINWCNVDVTGMVSVVKYTERQYGNKSSSPDAIRERVKRHRNKAKSDSSPLHDIPCNDVVTRRNGVIEEKRVEEKRVDKTITIGAGAPVGVSLSEPKRELTELEKSRTELENEFIRVTGIPVPEHKTEKQKRSVAERWWNALDEIYRIAGNNIETAKTLIAKAIQQSESTGMTYSSPASIVSNVRFVARKPIESVKAKPVTNGHKQTSADYYAKWEAKKGRGAKT